DDELASAAHLVWLRDSLRLGDKFPLKAGLITSLGFGHVSGLVALVHPQAFLAALDLSSGGITRSDSRLGCWPVSTGSRRRSPVGGRCSKSLPTAGSATRRRRSSRRPRCFSTRRRGSAMATSMCAPAVCASVPPMAVVGVGIDLVSIPDFAAQVDQPGTVFAETFTPGERRDAADKSSSAARHLAARWAAKEAVIKAWSGSRFSKRPMLPEGIHRDIEVITDM